MKTSFGKFLVFSMVLVINIMPLRSAAGATLDDLAFMAGHWAGPAFDGTGSETWTTNTGGNMAGMFKATMASGFTVIEFLIVTEKDDDIVMVWKHYNIDYTTWEDTPNVYRLAEVGAAHAVFEIAVENDRLPTQIIYRRNGDTLNIWAGDPEAEDQSGAIVLAFTLQ